MNILAFSAGRCIDLGYWKRGVQLLKNHVYFAEQLGCKSRWSVLIKIMEANYILYLIIYDLLLSVK